MNTAHSGFSPMRGAGRTRQHHDLRVWMDWFILENNST